MESYIVITVSCSLGDNFVRHKLITIPIIYDDYAFFIKCSSFVTSFDVLSTPFIVLFTSHLLSNGIFIKLSSGS